MGNTYIETSEKNVYCMNPKIRNFAFLIGTIF